MKAIIFNGEFEDGEVDLPYEDAWEATRGDEFEKFWTRGPPDEADGFEPGLTIFASTERPIWIASVSAGTEYSMPVVIEGEVNYLRFLASPLCSTLRIDEEVRAIRVSVERLFTAQHGHPPPGPYVADRHDLHGERIACAACDPDTQWYRNQCRQEAADKRKADAGRGDPGVS
jgi:hypothetical protein